MVFAHIDVSPGASPAAHAAAVRHGLEAVYPRLPSGGVCLLADYCDPDVYARPGTAGRTPSSRGRLAHAPASEARGRRVPAGQAGAGVLPLRRRVLARVFPQGVSRCGPRTCPAGAVSSRHGHEPPRHQVRPHRRTAEGRRPPVPPQPHGGRRLPGRAGRPQGRVLRDRPPAGGRGRGRRPRRAARRPPPAAPGPGGQGEEQVPLRPRRAALVRRRHPRSRPGRHRPPGQGSPQARRGPDRPGPQADSGPRPATAARTPPSSARASGSSCRSPASPWTRSWSCANEPLRRGNGGKPHWAEFCYRTGGETVYVCSRHPNGVTEAQYKAILAGSPKAKGWGWRTMRRNPGVYVKGRVRHADHATITLHGWHRVVMNTEGQSKAMRNVAFLD